MSDEMDRLRQAWQVGAAPEIDAALRRAAARAERSHRWGRWMMGAAIVFMLPFVWPGGIGWLGTVESVLVSLIAATGLSTCVITFVRWPRLRSGDVAGASVAATLRSLLRAREHRRWLWTGWFVRVLGMAMMALLLGLMLLQLLRPWGSMDPGLARALLIGSAIYWTLLIAWRELACARIEPEIEQLRLLLEAHEAHPLSQGAISGGVPGRWGRRALLACEGAVLVTALGLAWSDRADLIVAARGYTQALMTADDWGEEIRGLDARSRAPLQNEAPSVEDIAAYCDFRQHVAPALVAMRAADADLAVGVKLSVLGSPDGPDMVEWQRAGVRWEEARRDLLYEAHRTLWRKHLGPSRLRWLGEWVEWNSLGRPEAAAFALRGADGRRWFALRLRLRALAGIRGDASGDDRVVRARVNAQAEIDRLEAVARSRLTPPQGVPLDGCPAGSLDPIEDIAWLALLDTAEPIWEEAAW